MRTREEVKEKIIMLRDRYLKERKCEYLSRKPVNCIYAKKAKMLCGKAIVCTDPFSKEFSECNCDICGKCRRFVCKNTDESVVQDFNEIVKSPSRCGSEYPKLAILLWFLQDFNAEVAEKKHTKWFF